MKLINAFLGALLIFGGLVLSDGFARAEDTLSKTELTNGNYCHIQFPAIRGATVVSGNPVLKSPASSDIIDFYGPCDENPVGERQATSQRIQNYDRFNEVYSD